MQNKIQSLRYVQPQKILSVEVGTQAVRVVLREIEQYQILEEASRELASVDKKNIEQMVELVRGLCRTEFLEVTRYVALTLPAEDVFTTKLTLPQLKDKELEQAMYWEQQRYLPWQVEDCCTAYCRLEQQEGMQEILLAAVEKEAVDFWDEVLYRAGLTLVAVTLPGEVYPYRLNLLPQGQERLRKPLTRLYRGGALACLLTGLLLLGGAWCWQRQSEANLLEVQQELASLKLWEQRYELQQKQAQEADRLQRQLADLESRRLTWSKVLPAVTDALPADCWLQIVRSRENGSVELQGKALGVKQLQNFTEALGGAWSRVELQNTRTEADEGITAYTLLLQGGKADGE